MLHKLIKGNPDILQLLEGKYEVQIKGLHLFVHSVPYVNSSKKIDRGTLVAKLALANDKTATPDHVVFFTGDQPCDVDGNIITAIQHQTQRQTFEGVVVQRSFSGNPTTGAYSNYHEMMTRYVDIISAPAKMIDPQVTAQTGNFIESEEVESVFEYPDTNTTRAEIAVISAKLQDQKIGIIGLGGTGSYVLDFVSKTHVKEIHLFDEDDFLNHNAFRAPGAAPKEAVEAKSKKVRYLHSSYSKMHKGITPHEYHINETNSDELSGLDFVFVCVDKGEVKRHIFEKLKNDNIPFLDTGIDILSIENALTGCVRTTLVTPDKNDHVINRVSQADEENALYSRNIQIAELNALNASLAVIKWKKFFGFYHDLEKEHHSAYETNINKVINDETIS